MTLTIPLEYLDILKVFGSVDELIAEAVRRYTIERINERIATAQQEVAMYESKYGMDYQVFHKNITSDLDFLTDLRQKHSLWERDFNVWEFYVEELVEWQTRLKNISKY